MSKVFKVRIVMYTPMGLFYTLSENLTPAGIDQVESSIQTLHAVETASFTLEGGNKIYFMSEVLKNTIFVLEYLNNA